MRNKDEAAGEVTEADEREKGHNGKVGMNLCSVDSVTLVMTAPEGS